MDVHVATDLWGAKDNVTIRVYERNASLDDLLARVEAVYQTEMITRRPDDVAPRDVPPFRVAIAQLLVEGCGGAQSWVDLVSSEQLYPGCQLFVFQPPSKFVSDACGPIPPARFADEARAEISPRRCGPRPTQLEQANIAHRLLNLDRAPQITTVRVRTLRRVLRDIGRDAIVARGPFAFLTHAPRAASPHRSGTQQAEQSLTFVEWMSFCETHPDVISEIITALSDRDCPPPTIVSHSSPDDVDRRDMSPVRRASRSDTQQLASQRLYEGFSSIATKRDRDAAAAPSSHVALISRPASTGRSVKRTPSLEISARWRI